MTPSQLVALNAKIQEEQKEALAWAIRYQLQLEFAEDRKEAEVILDQLDTLHQKITYKKKQIQSHMSGAAEKIEQRRSIHELKEDVRSVINSIGI
ncbi:hypothetical protein [Bacillus sp. NPDC093026]|uniref:hypothetical protein n=1 Tax=Bacillus sp. NPDC093026 TaxID=3363948 RepID=UPI0037FBE96F